MSSSGCILRGGRGRLRPGLSLLERAAISFTQALIQGAPPPIRLPAGSISPQESWEETHIWPITMGAARGNLKIRNVLNAWGAGKNRLVLVEELTGVLLGFSYL